jgi:hypothetical protein
MSSIYKYFRQDNQIVVFIIQIIYNIYDLKGLWEKWMNVSIGGNVFLRQDFRAVGEVRLHGTTITGNLECQDECFFNSNPKRSAVLADGVKVGGDVILSAKASEHWGK